MILLSDDVPCTTRLILCNNLNVCITMIVVWDRLGSWRKKKTKTIKLLWFSNQNYSLYLQFDNCLMDYWFFFYTSTLLRWICVHARAHVCVLWFIVGIDRFVASPHSATSFTMPNETSLYAPKRLRIITYGEVGGFGCVCEHRTPSCPPFSVMANCGNQHV